MIYDSLDILPLKLFLRILKTKDTSLLTDDKELLFKTDGIWNKLEKDFDILDPENDVDKVLKNLIKVAKYRAQYNAIKISVHALRFERDHDLENLVRSQGFALGNKSFSTDLDRVEIDCEAINLLIKEYSDKLPKKNKETGEKAGNLDEVILGYCSITGLQYTNTNTITVTQFYALKKVFDSKAKQAQEQTQKAKSKTKK